MYGKFHDENYDGVVLKIPSWFISMNGLEKDFEAFELALKGAKLSTLYKDHLNNIYELENIATKKDLTQQQKEAEERYRKETAEKQSKLFNGEIFELQWGKESRYLNFDYVRFEGKNWSFDDYMTNKYNIKASFLKEIMPMLDTHEKLKTFAGMNCVSLSADMEHAPPEFFDMNFNFYPTSDGTLGISYSHLEVRYNYKKTKTGYNYNRGNLVQFEDGCLGINAGGNFEDWRRLEGFERRGMYLVKK